MTQTYTEFRFENYSFDHETAELTLQYSFDGVRKYTEKVAFTKPEGEYNKEVLDRLCFLVHILAGSSYYKSFPVQKFVISNSEIDYWQADFFNLLYQGGLSQYIYENKLTKQSIGRFEGTGDASSHPEDYDGAGVLMMQSGGKDSLLAAELMKEADNEFTSWHMSTTGKYPPVLDELGTDVLVSKRTIDLAAIKEDWENGGLNGHVPFSAIFASYALIQAVLHDKNLVIASNESSADEANVIMDGFAINHQFSKTFEVEQAIENYLRRYVSEDLHYGSILRPMNELQVARLFAEKGWPKYRKSYSSCNLANYKQGKDDGALSWDGTCPKCANTFVLMAPFVEKEELLELFSGKNLLQDAELTETYRQLFGLSDIKPFECVGSFDELQQAYNQAVEKDTDYKNAKIPTKEVNAELDQLGPYQSFFDEFIDYKKYV